MIAQTLSFFALVAVVAAGTAEETTEPSWPLEGVDPNTLNCDPTGQEFLLLPHFEDCTKFYSCDNGKEVEFHCPAPLIFDFVLQTCNWGWATECSLRTPDKDEEGSGEEDLNSAFGEEPENGHIVSLTGESTGTVRPLSALKHFNGILNCNNAADAARQVPYKGDCQRYWKCVNGSPQTLYCSDGLFFNQATQQCDHEPNSKCNVAVDDELQGEFIVYDE